MAEWYVARTSIGSSEVLGPYDEQAIRRMLAAGQLNWNDQVTRGGSEPWRPIASVPEFGPPPWAQPSGPPPRPPGPTGPTTPHQSLPPALSGYERHFLIAALLAFFLGGFGVRKFYNGSWGWGIVYLLLCWTFLPALVALIEGIVYLVNPAGYDRNYNHIPPHPWKW